MEKHNLINFKELLNETEILVNRNNNLVEQLNVSE